MEVLLKNLAKNALIAEVGQDARITAHKNMINIVSVCLGSSGKNASSLVKEAIEVMGGAELVASSIFDFNFQMGMFKGTRLLRDSTYGFSDEWRNANEQKYLGLTAVFGLMELSLSSPDAQPILEELKFVCNQKIMSHLIFN